jgi:nucleoside-triphosphatase
VLNQVSGASTPVFVVDEIGKMELFSSNFKKLLSQMLNNRSISLLATIPVMSASPIPLVEEVRRHPDVLLMEVDHC